MSVPGRTLTPTPPIATRPSRQTEPTLLGMTPIAVDIILEPDFERHAIVVEEQEIFFLALSRDKEEQGIAIRALVESFGEDIPPDRRNNSPDPCTVLVSLTSEHLACD